GLQPELRQHAHVLAPARAGRAARPGRVRLRPLHEGQRHVQVQGAVGGLAGAGRVAILPPQRHGRRHAARQPALPAPHSPLAPAAGERAPAARPADRARHSLSRPMDALYFFLSEVMQPFTILLLLVVLALVWYWRRRQSRRRLVLLTVLVVLLVL